MKTRALTLLTLMAAGRAMTLAFIHRAGDGGPGDPPDAWLMPLLGDAAIGLTAIAIAWLVWNHRTPVVWLAAMIWNALAIFDALAAFVVETTVPWPEFFMLEIFGRSMFVLAIALHLVVAALLVDRETRAEFGIDLDAPDLTRTTS